MISMKIHCKLLLLTLLLSLSFTNSVAQVENYCLKLSPGGSVDCGPMPELNGLSAFTIQFWFNAETWTQDATLFSRGDDLYVRIGAENTLDFKFGTETFSLKRLKFAVGTWVPVMIMAKSNRITVYVDNNLVKTVSKTITLSDLGSNFIFGGDNYSGRIDEVRIWSSQLESDYEYFTYTTLNKWTPQLKDLVAYFKFDQPWCENIVDYKALFSPKQKTNHHGIMSQTGAKREKVTDNNAGLPYLLMGGYTDIKRFYDNGIEADKYLLSNDLIFLGLQSYSDGHVKPLCLNDHGTAKKCEYLDLYKNIKRKGVLSLAGKGSYLECPSSVFTPSNAYTIETWLYLEEWTEGAFIFKKETTNSQNGLSIRLGSETDKQVIVRIDGREYFFKTPLRTGTWTFLALTPGDAASNRNTVYLYINTKAYQADAELSNASTEFMPSGMNDQKVYIGLNLNGKLDETMVWHKTFAASDISAHRQGTIPMPGPGKPVQIALMNQASAYYGYDNPDNLGWDYYSMDEWRNIMARCYDGYSGFRIRAAVQTHNNWQTTISDANKRKIFAADVAANCGPYSGIELDLEWMDGTQTNLGLLADEILAVLPKDKTLYISMHQYGAYKYPKEKISKIHGFTFQQYGPQKNWYSYQSFVDGYNAFKNYGYPDNKIYLSYGSTTSNGFDANNNYAREIIGYNWGLVGDSYVPATDGSLERAQWNGNYFYFAGPVQIYNRAKFVRDNQLMGLFYWDICNDITPSNKLSLNRNANFALNANVDPRADEVIVNHPTAIREVVVNKDGSRANSEESAYDLSGRRINPKAVGNGIIILRDNDGNTRKMLVK